MQWKTTAVSPVFITLFSSSPLFSPCILWTTKAKDYEVPKLGFFINLSFPKALPWTKYSSPSFINCFGEHKAIKKHQNLTQLLETIARVPNMLIELKDNNYYSRVFKRDYYKLLNSMFWVVITYGNTYNSSWRNHPNFSWKPRPPPYQPQAQTQAPQQTSSVEQASVNLSKVMGDFVGEQKAINSQLHQKIENVESSQIKRMDGMQNDLYHKIDNIQYSISRLTNLNTVNKKGKFPSQPS